MIFKPPILGVGHDWQTVLRGAWIHQNQNWLRHREIIPTQEVCFGVRKSCCVFKQRLFKVEWCWKRRQISHFWPPCCNCNLRPPEPRQPFPALITTPCHVWRRWTYSLPYYSVFLAAVTLCKNVLVKLQPLSHYIFFDMLCFMPNCSETTVELKRGLLEEAAHKYSMTWKLVFVYSWVLLVKYGIFLYVWQRNGNICCQGIAR